MHPQDKGWNNVSKWYDRLVGEHGSDYHRNVIIPGALKLLKPKAGEAILDVACGQGVFCRKLAENGAQVTGVDVSPELIKAARQRSPEIKYQIADAKNLRLFKDQTFNAVSCIMAIMNIDPLEPAIREMKRVVKKDGRIILVLNHPAFRIPRQSSWEWDEKKGVQYRRIDGYMSEQKVPIQMQPGYDPEAVTWTFHRPLSAYTKIFTKLGLKIAALEEWLSHRVSDKGSRKLAEDRSRREFPLFLAILLEAAR